MVNVLQEGIDNGGSSISDYYNADGEKGTMQENIEYMVKSVWSMWRASITKSHCYKKYALLSKLSKVGVKMAKVIGLTGGIATGKSTVSRILKR